MGVLCSSLSLSLSTLVAVLSSSTLLVLSKRMMAVALGSITLLSSSDTQMEAMMAMKVTMTTVTMTTMMAPPTPPALWKSGGTHARTLHLEEDSRMTVVIIITGRFRTLGDPGGVTKDSSKSRSQEAMASAVSIVSSSGSKSQIATEFR